ncbi:2-oxoadipate dioxygenase/decarboxylase HglS [Altericroceibacterium xinjiangense]|uniref:2-oxoadipate dioxygenase/decarboxylase HglS n=1 Tax=Altericroceibacterium xinjiangense TaxID=762261 RepID=UPI000F7DD2FA|nr:VOC family protein [Altericroceibacterium xinjiangense]
MQFVPSDHVRAAFSATMSAMYRTEVPLYGDLLDIVAGINAAVLERDDGLRQSLASADELDRLDSERHGAIRVGTAEELRLLRRAFALMGMKPVGYYDLTVAGVPVHSTAFRPVELEALQHSPFRVFTSLLRLDLIEDADLRREAGELLGARRIASSRAVDLVETGERQGGLDPAQADEFVAEAVDIFRWHSEANVPLDTYGRLKQAHPLIADVVSFKGPHINHLTPRVLDIDAAHAEMQRRGMEAKAVIEGPPRRAVPILLRQTSFKALEESVQFPGAISLSDGTHTARFGEIEQRGVALTPAGRALYDSCLDEARGQGGSQALDYPDRLSAAFARFPDDLQALRQQKLAHFRYTVTAEGRDNGKGDAGRDPERWIAEGWAEAYPLVYEDFLPVSAAGIFQSNLGGQEQGAYAGKSSQDAFERALGTPVLDPFMLYEAIEQASLEAAAKAVGAAVQ